MATTATTQINDHNFTLDEGTFYAKGQQPVVLEDIDTSKGTFVRFEAANGKSNLFGWSPLAGGIVDGSDIDQKQILFGGAPNGSSTITGGNRNDSIYADGGDLVKLSSGFDKIYRTEDNSGGLTIDMADGSKAARSEVVEGFDLDNDVIKIDSANDISARMLDGKLALDKGNSRLTFAELGSFEAADGLKVDTGNEVYTLDSSYDSGISGEDFFWRDSNDRYYKAGTDFYIDDYADNRDYHIGTTAGNLTIDGFEFGTEGDALCLNSAEGLGMGLNDLYVESPDGGDLVELSGGFDKIYRTEDNSGGLTIDMADGSKAARSEVVEGFDIDQDVIKIDSANDISARMLDGKLALDKGNSRLTFAELGSFEAANGLKVDTGNEVYTLDSSYDSGISGEDFFWRDSNDRYYKAGTDFYIDDYADNRDYHIGTTAGNMTIDGFEFGTEGDALCLNSAEGLGAGYGNTFFYTKGDGNDQIRNAADGDVINLGDITLDDISSTLIMNAGVKLDFNDGGSLMLANGADVTFKLADGTSYSADYNSHSWKAND